MREVSDNGCEVGYHYEEIADYIKKHHLTKREQVINKIEIIRQNFLENLKHFEDILGEKVVTVASHGDFANRALGIANYEILDSKTRECAGIQLEAYDPALEGKLDFRCSDAMYPRFWNPNSPEYAIKQGSTKILVLIHPRQWQRAPLERFKIDMIRAHEGFKFFFKKRLHA